MHKQFADWYRSAAVVPPQELLEERWAGVAEASSELTSDHLLQLLRLFAIQPNVGYETPPFLDAAFRNHDSSFPTRGHTAELRILAGAILRNSIEDRSDAAVAASYGLISSSFGSRYPGLPDKGHVEAARRFLSIRAGEIRDEISLPEEDSTSHREALDEKLPANVFGVNQVQHLREPLLDVLSEQSGRIQALVTRATADLKRVVQTQREELNLLWWLQTAVSKDLNTPFSECNSLTAACVFPTELSNLTVFVPAPSAIFGMLVSALRETKGARQSSILEVVNATSREWREGREFTDGRKAVDVLCPVLFAMHKSLETDGPDDWVPIYKKRCDVKVDDVFQNRDIAMQVYNELMLVRAIHEMSDD
jgi:GTPase-associated system helical domain